MKCNDHAVYNAYCAINRMDMRFAGNRLKTFYDFAWPVPLSALKLAEAGFYYLGTSDYVQSFCCKNVLCDWQADDIPAVEHRRLSNECLFALGHRCGNVPLFENPFELN